MPYKGETYRIPFNVGGLNHNQNQDLISPTAMIHPSRNLSLHRDGREKRGGTAIVDIIDRSIISSIVEIGISYYDVTNRDLKYASKSSGSWVTTTIDSTGEVGFYTSIVIDSNNKVHISYFDDTTDDLKYATNESGSWVITTVDSTGDVGRYSSIAIDSNDKLHISYYDFTNGYLKYITNESGSWVITTVDSTGDVGRYSSIAIDSNNKVHISYFDDTTDDLKYATNESGSWVITTVDTTDNVGQYTSIAIDSNNKVHISCQEILNHDLKYATNESGSWVITTVDSTGSVGSFSSIAIDSNDKIHISYYDFTFPYGLKYATNESGSWVTTTIDSADTVGSHTSIFIDSNDKIYISYYHFTNRDLKYASKSSGSWVTTTIDSTGEVGQYTSIFYNKLFYLSLPRLWGLYQFRLKNGNEFILTATSDGKIIKDYTTELKTGLTINQPVHFVTFNNLCIICTGNDVPQVWDGSASSTTDLTNVPSDWSGVNQPRKMVRHGRGTSDRLWAFGVANKKYTLYASDLNAGDDSTEPDFKDASVLTFYIDTGDGWGLINAVEFGNRLVLFSKQRAYLIDDADYDSSNWGYEKAQWEGGCGSDRLVALTPNDIVCMTEDLEIYSASAAQSYGDYKQASISKPSFINEWLREYVAEADINDFHMIYDPYIRALRIFIKRNGIAHVDTCLKYYIDRGPIDGWMIDDNQDYDSGFKASCSALVRISTGQYKIYTGGWSNGNIWKLEESNKNDNGNGYYAGMKLPNLTFENARTTKRYDKGWCIAKTGGNYNLNIDWWIDSVKQTQRTLSLTGTGGILGSFILGTSILGGIEFVDESFDLGNIGKRIQCEIFNSNANEDFFVAQFLIDFQPLRKGVE